MTVIERWTIEGVPGLELRTLVNVSGRSISCHEQVRVVKESDYDALAGQLAGTVRERDDLRAAARELRRACRDAGSPVVPTSVAEAIATVTALGGQS